MLPLANNEYKWFLVQFNNRQYKIYKHLAGKKVSFEQIKIFGA